jgi:hypothetical protein
MKGIVFNLLEEAVVDAHGEDVWESILEAAGVEGAYTSLGNYPDAEALRLVAALCEQVGSTPAEALRGFGRVALPGLVERFPEVVDAHDSAKAFLLTIDDTVHPDVVKLYPDARPPRFFFEDPGPGVLVMHYESERRLCAMAEGMIESAAAHFDETAHIDQTSCTLRGDARCTFVVTFG